MTLLIPYENSSFVNNNGTNSRSVSFHHDINLKLATIELYDQYYYRNYKID